MKATDLDFWLDANKAHELRAVGDGRFVVADRDSGSCIAVSKKEIDESGNMGSHAVLVPRPESTKRVISSHFQTAQSMQAKADESSDSGKVCTINQVGAVVCELANWCEHMPDITRSAARMLRGTGDERFCRIGLALLDLADKLEELKAGDMPENET